MQVVLEIPSDIVSKLESGWSDIPRRALEALAVAAYRSDLLTVSEVQGMLGLSSRRETDDLLKSAGAFLEYSEDDLGQDLETLRRLTPS